MSRATLYNIKVIMSDREAGWIKKARRKKMKCDMGAHITESGLAIRSVVVRRERVEHPSGVRFGTELTYEAWCEPIRAGRTHREPRVEAMG